LSEQKTSDSLEQSLDNGIDKASAAKGAVDAAQGIGNAAAGAGASAAESAAGAGAGAGASAGAGAAAGTAAAPGAGTAIGAVAGLAVSILAKPLAKGVIVIVFFLALIFSSLPSMLFEEPVDVADNTGPETVYQQFKDYAMEAYDKEIEDRKKEIEDAFQWRVYLGEFDDYDDVEMTYEFIPPEDVFRADLEESAALIIAMFEISTDDWRVASFSKFKSAVNSVNFWHNTVTVSKESEETEVTHEDGDRILHVHMTYNIYDMGVEQFRSKFGLSDDREYIKAVEMAYNLRVYFGEAGDMPMGGVTGGVAAGSYPGGGTHNLIRQLLARLEDTPEFFGGACIIPLQSYSYISSEFGPRNYAKDPIHTGIDFAADSGTPVYAGMDGIVLMVRDTGNQGFGRHIVVYHGNTEQGGVTTMYAHMSAYGSYGEGDTVSAGDTIGYVGRTGLSTGDHLHFEYQIEGTAYNPRQILPPV